MSFLYSVRLEEAASNDVLVDLVIYLYTGHLLLSYLNIYTLAATKWLKGIIIINENYTQIDKLIDK